MRTLSQRLAALMGLLLGTSPLLAQPVDLPVASTVQETAFGTVRGARQPCTNGLAAGFPCHEVDLLAFVPIADLGGAQNVGGAGTVSLNDIWGWTDPETGREYALVGRTDGTAFVDVSNPLEPAFLGLLPRTEGASPSSWRDIKVYADHAFIVSEATGHGMQVFDLTTLRGLSAAPTRLFPEAGHYDGISRAHNLVINEATGFAYAVGSRTPSGGPSCGFGLHIIDIQMPTEPTFAGCFTDFTTGRAGNGYTHDAQCVVYQGPDSRYTGQEICFGANETALSIADVTDKDNPQKLSALSYPNVAYAHQGWLSEDQRYFFLDDELDELNRLVPKTRTLVFDVSELDSPVLIGQHLGVASSIDHNQYVVEDYSFQANYTSGLRILDVSAPDQLEEVAFFDTFPASDATQFSGLWSVYPFFASQNVVVSDIGQGLFILAPTSLSFRASPVRPPATPPGVLPTALTLTLSTPVVTGSLTATLGLPETRSVDVALYDAAGRRVAEVFAGTPAPGRYPLAFDASDLASGVYFLHARAGAVTQTRSLVVVR